MKKIILIIVFLYSNQTIFTKDYLVIDNFVKHTINNPFHDFPIQNEKATKSIQEFFGNSKYRVIFSYRIGPKPDFERLYFAVEEAESEKYYNAIKRGIFVWESGKVFGTIDTKTGFTSDEGIVFDLKELGLENSVKYYVLGFYNDMKNYIDDRDKRKVVTAIFTLDIGILDYNDYQITQFKASAGLFTISLFFQKYKDHKIIQLFSLASDKYEFAREAIEAYKKGVRIKSAAVKTEFEKLVRAGLVEGFSVEDLEKLKKERSK